MRAYFAEGGDVADHADAGLAGRRGRPRRRCRDGGAGRRASSARRCGLAEQEARELDIHAVPTFVIERRFAIPGAQDPETFVAALARMQSKLADEAGRVPVGGSATSAISRLRRQSPRRRPSESDRRSVAGRVARARCKASVHRVGLADAVSRSTDHLRSRAVDRRRCSGPGDRRAGTGARSPRRCHVLELGEHPLVRAREPSSWTSGVDATSIRGSRRATARHAASPSIESEQREVVVHRRPDVRRAQRVAGIGLGRATPRQRRRTPASPSLAHPTDAPY